MRGAFLPSILDGLHISNLKGSYIFIIPSIGAWVGSQVVPWLLQYYEDVFLWRISVATIAASALLLLAADTFIQVNLCFALFGVGFGLLQVTQYIVLGRASSNESHMRTLVSGLQCTYAGAAIFAPVLAGAIIHYHFNWRWGFASVGALCLAFVLMTLFMGPKALKQKPKQAQKLPALSIVPFLFVAFMFACYLGAELALTTRLVLFVHKEHLLSPELAQMYLFSFFIGLFSGRFLFSVYPFPDFSSEKILCAFMALSVCSIFAGLYVSAYFLIFCGFFIAPIFGMFMHYFSITYKSQKARALAYALGLGSFGVMVVHLLVGYLSDLYGVGAALFICVPLLLISMLCVVTHKAIFKGFLNTI